MQPICSVSAAQPLSLACPPLPCFTLASLPPHPVFLSLYRWVSSGAGGLAGGGGASASVSCLYDPALHRALQGVSAKLFAQASEGVRARGWTAGGLEALEQLR
jgi:hypothetical protein